MRTTWTPLSTFCSCSESSWPRSCAPTRSFDCSCCLELNAHATFESSRRLLESNAVIDCKQTAPPCSKLELQCNVRPLKPTSSRRHPSPLRILQCRLKLGFHRLKRAPPERQTLRGTRICHSHHRRMDDGEEVCERIPISCTGAPCHLLSIERPQSCRLQRTKRRQWSTAGLCRQVTQPENLQPGRESRTQRVGRRSGKWRLRCSRRGMMTLAKRCRNGVHRRLPEDMSKSMSTPCCAVASTILHPHIHSQAPFRSVLFEHSTRLIPDSSRASDSCRDPTTPAESSDSSSSPPPVSPSLPDDRQSSRTIPAARRRIAPVSRTASCSDSWFAAARGSTMLR